MADTDTRMQRITSEIMLVPNLVTLARLPLAVLIVIFIHSPLRFVFAGLLLLSDVADGRIARWTGTVSETGRLLDPIMDKAVVIVLVPFIFPAAGLPLTYLLLFFSRELFLLVLLPVGYLQFRGDAALIDTRQLGKTVTTLQFAVILLLIAPAPVTAAVLLWVIGVGGVLAMIDYTLAYYRAQGEAWVDRPFSTVAVATGYFSVFLPVVAIVLREELLMLVAAIT